MNEVSSLASPEVRKALLRLARRTAEAELGSPIDPATSRPKVHGTFGGAFVTFWSGDRLRGCVGRFGATSDLAATIASVTTASLADRRFASDPIDRAELDSLNIQISVLSDTAPTDNPLSLIPGVHGIVIQRGGRTGCFLPNVATQRGWSAEEFLAQCCTMKAGLEPDAWRRADTEVRLFTAEVFAEAEYANDART